MAKMSITGNCFEDLLYAIDAAGGDIYKAADEALTETADLIQENLVTAAAVYDRKGKKGYATGKMYKSIIKDASVQWAGTIATVNSGFNLHTKGGWHSIFIMYGTPRISKDQKVYNAIKGTKTKKEIAAKQEEVLRKYINLEGKKK